LIDFLLPSIHNLSHMADALPNPLHDLHKAREVEFQPYEQLEIVSTFGQPEAEYAAVRKAAALMDLPQRGVLELTGKDRLPFLNNLLTNQTWDKAAKSGLAVGTGVYAYFLNLKGRIVADMNVLELGERTLLETDVRMVDVLAKAFEKFIFSEQVRISSMVGRMHRISLHGTESGPILNDASGRQLAELGSLASVQVELFGIEMIVFRDDECAVPGIHLIVPFERAGELWTKLLNQFSNPLELGKRRLRAIGWAAYNACRIEGGRPLFDIDFGNSVNPDLSVLPAEAGQFDRAVSVTKGCYLGQEIVARMHARQQVAKQLVGLRVAEDALPVAGATIFDDAQNQIGVVTSSTISPILSGACIAMGYLKKPFFAVGTVVNVPADAAMRKGAVTELPFLTIDK
jgi:folate-binding protein YgfZ